MEQSSQSFQSAQNPRTIIIKQEQKATNGMGTAGFVLALSSVFLGWIPFFGWLIWLLGVIFSFVGVFKAPRGLAIAGLVISFLGVILIIFVFGALLMAIGIGA